MLTTFQGLGETSIMALGKNAGSNWKTYVVKPGGVMPSRSVLKEVVGKMLGSSLSIGILSLAVL